MVDKIIVVLLLLLELGLLIASEVSDLKRSKKRHQEIQKLIYSMEIEESLRDTQAKQGDKSPIGDTPTHK